MMTISIDLSKAGKSFKTEIYGQSVPACDCGDGVARWLSRFLLQEDIGLRLVCYPVDEKEPYRDISRSIKVFPLLKNEHAVSLNLKY